MTSIKTHSFIYMATGGSASIVRNPHDKSETCLCVYECDSIVYVYVITLSFKIARNVSQHVLYCSLLIYFM